MAIPKDKLDELKAKHGANLYTYASDDLDFAFRRPASAEYRKHQMQIATDRANTFDATEALIKACVVYPDREELDRILEDWPGLVNDLGGEILLVAMRSPKADAKKA
jgi:hypothetical protein